MGVRFGDLYEEMLTLEQAIARMETDIASSGCDSITRCVLDGELFNLQEQYKEISETEFDFEKLNFITIVESLERCLHCIEFEGEFSDLAPEPIAVASSCGTKSFRLELEDFDSVIIHEKTATVTKYEFIRSAMPYQITTGAGERYNVTYDSLRKGISVKGFNRESSKSITGFGNIAMVEVILSPHAQAKYGIKKLAACKVLLTTPTPMDSLAPLSFAVDSSTATCPIVGKTSASQVEMVFQFYV